MVKRGVERPELGDGEECYETLSSGSDMEIVTVKTQPPPSAEQVLKSDLCHLGIPQELFTSFLKSHLSLLLSTLTSLNLFIIVPWNSLKFV